MVDHELLPAEGILILRPKGRLEAADFENLAREVDPYIEANGHLHGLMIAAEAFPGWSDFAAFVAHLRFVRDHHTKIERVAVVSDSGFLSAAPKVAGHFVRADLRHFPQSQGEAAAPGFGDRAERPDWSCRGVELSSRMSPPRTDTARRPGRGSSSPWPRPCSPGGRR